MKSILVGGPANGQTIEVGPDLDTFFMVNERGERFEYQRRRIRTSSPDLYVVFARAGLSDLELGALIRVKDGQVQLVTTNG